MSPPTKLFGHSCYYTSVEEGEVVPVGGGSIFDSATVDRKIRADFDNFFPRYAEHFERARQNFQEGVFENWCKEVAPTVDPKLLVTLQIFTSAFEAKWAKQDREGNLRDDAYRNAPEKTVNLSTLFANNTAMCVEIALVAKKHLDTMGIKSHFYNGEVMLDFDKDPNELNFTSPHAFLVIEHGKKEYIFDPAQPLQQSDGRCIANVLEPAQTLLSGDVETQKTFVEADNVMTHRKAYYGVGNLASVTQEDVVFFKADVDTNTSPGRPCEKASGERPAPG